MKAKSYSQLSNLLNLFVLLIFPVIVSFSNSMFPVIFNSEKLIFYCLRISIILFTSFAIGEAISVVYWFALDKKNYSILIGLVYKYPRLSNILLPVFLIIVIGTLYSVFRNIGNSIISGLIAVIIGGVFGYSFNIECLLENSDNKRKAYLSRKHFDHSLIDNLGYLVTFLLCFLPSAWFTDQLIEKPLIKILIYLLLIYLIYYFGNILNRFVFKKFEINKNENNIRTIVSIMLLNLFSNIGFLFWDYNTTQLLSEVEYTSITKILILVFIGYLPIRLIQTMFSEQRKSIILLNIICLLGYFYFKIIRI